MFPYFLLTKYMFFSDMVYIYKAVLFIYKYGIGPLTNST